MVALWRELAPVVGLYNTQQAWTKTEGGFCVRAAYPPAFAFDVPGAIKHRVGLNEKGKPWSSDQVPYTLSVWTQGKCKSTITSMIDPLPSPARQFIPRVAKPSSKRPEDWYMPGHEPVEMLREWGVPLVGDHAAG